MPKQERDCPRLAGKNKQPAPRKGTAVCSPHLVSERLAHARRGSIDQLGGDRPPWQRSRCSRSLATPPLKASIAWRGSSTGRRIAPVEPSAGRLLTFLVSLRPLLLPRCPRLVGPRLRLFFMSLFSLWRRRMSAVGTRRRSRGNRRGLAAPIETLSVHRFLNRRRHFLGHASSRHGAPACP